MTNDEIDERYHDAALDDDGEGWTDAEAGGDAWDDPETVTDEELDPDLDEEGV